VPKADPTFPSLHIRPARGWLNDPNGVCRVDGRYHVFFQYNPHAPHHEAIQWGHASSTDLLRWTDEPVALQPREGGVDAAGCWSGCVVDDDGVPTAVYTGVPDTAQHAQVVLATSDRSLREWQQQGSVMAPPDDPAVQDVRDPFVFSHLGRRYAIQGAGHREGRPQILLYGCDNLTAWTELGPLLTFDDPLAAAVAPANIWECPNLVEVDGRWVLIVSQWQWVDGTHLLAGVRYLLGELEPAGAGLRFRVSAGGMVDDGPTYYAPQALVEPGRVLLWAWAEELGRSTGQLVAAGWAGVLTFPRELYLDQGRLGSRPAAELLGLRRERLPWSAGVGFRERAFEIEAVGPVRLRLVDPSPADPSPANPSPANPSPANPSPANPGTSSPGPDGTVVDVGTSGQAVRILVDGSLVEVFAGPTPTTLRAYPSATSLWALDADPGSTVWRLGLP
jgi:beta-fructofuranosidase